MAERRLYFDVGHFHCVYTQINSVTRFVSVFIIFFHSIKQWCFFHLIKICCYPDLLLLFRNISEFF